MSFLRTMVEKDCSATAALFIATAGFILLGAIFAFDRGSPSTSVIVDAVKSVLLVSVGYFAGRK